MQKTQILLITVIVATVMAASTFALMTIQRDIQGSGSIRGVGLGIYWEPQCQNPTTSIDFGLLDPGSYTDVTLYLRNEGNTDLILNMTSGNWNPIEAGSYISLTWNREGQQISPDQVVSFVITLSVSESIQDIASYSLDITISGTG